MPRSTTRAGHGFLASEAAARADAKIPAQIDHFRVELNAKNEGIFQESAKKVGVTVHMTAFSIAADSHRKWAIGWAVASGLCAAFLILGALRAIAEGQGPPLATESWYVAANLSHYLARALVVSLVSFLMVFFTRNFRSAKHNEVVNRHRAGALATRDTLLTTQGNRGDDVVNLRVAEAVFTAQPSGYVEGDGHGTHITELLDFVRNNRG